MTFFSFHKIKTLMNAHWLNTLATEMLHVWIQSEATDVLVIRGIQGTAIHVQVVHIVIIIFFCVIFAIGKYMYWALMIIKEWFFSDIDECSSSNVCHSNAMCNNTVGSYICKCNPGYTGDGKNCTSSCFHFLW